MPDDADYEPDDGATEMLGGAEALDASETGDTNDLAVDPPQGWAEADGFGTTAREAAEGETLERKLRREQPENT